MKKFVRCFSAVVLSFAIIISCVAPLSFAAPNQAEETGKCDCGFSPVVYVAALGSAGIYSNAGTENEKLLFRPETEQYLELAKNLIVPLVSLAVTKDYDKFGDSLITELDKIFGEIAMDDNGDSLPYVTAKGSALPTNGAHDRNSSYYFGYDFRADPLVTAEKLHEYIERVEKITGHDRVNIRASSMGGVMTMAYIYKYGTDDIDSLIFQCCPIKGTQVAGELLSKKVEINSDAVMRYAVQALPELENPAAESMLKVLLFILDKTGAFDGLVGFVNRLASNILDKLYDEFLIPVLGKMPGLWSFVPDNDYETAKLTVLDESRNEKLIKRLDEYHYNVQCKAEEILRQAKSDGVRIMIVAGYNMQRTPLVESYMSNSDATVDTKYASVGATVAEIGKTLDGDYAQKLSDGHNHLSADGVIDASTCALPDNTWFIKDMMHCSTHNAHTELYRWFFDGEEEYTVFSNPDYPQFLQNDIVNQTFTAVK